MSRPINQINLPNLIQESVKLKKHGSTDLIGHCPYHNDKTPSLVVTPNKGLWHCLGACQTGGSAVDWLMKRDHLTVKQALDKLEKQHGLAPNKDKRSATLLKQAHTNGKLKTADVLLKSQEPAKKENKMEKEMPAQPDNDPQEINSPSLAGNILLDLNNQKLLKRCLDFFKLRLKQTQQAQDYLETRGLTHPGLLEEFQIGFADNTFLQRLPAGREGSILKNQLKEIGILTQTGRLLFNDCLIFPILDNDGNILQIYGRAIKDKASIKHLYLPHPQDCLFNPKALNHSELILTESIIDALSFWVHGFYHVSCTYSAGNISDNMINKIKDKNIERIYLALDHDDAGEAGVNKFLDKFAGNINPDGVGTELMRVYFDLGPAGKKKDANDLITTSKAPLEDLQLCLQAAFPVSANTSGKTNGTNAPENRNLFADLLNAKNKQTENELTHKDGVHYYTVGPRTYRIVGLTSPRNLNPESLKVHLKVENSDTGKFHLDNEVDVYASKARRHFIKSASDELELDLEVIKKDFASLLTLLEQKQAQMLAAKNKDKNTLPLVIAPAAKQDALDYLKHPSLVDNIIKDFNQTGLVGEDDNALISYLATSSRKENKPLAVIIQSSSGAGKSTLMDAVLKLMPAESIVKFSALTSQSLYYMEEDGLKNKILAIVEEEGAEAASYSLKLLQSEGKVSIATTVKDATSGQHVTHIREVEGPVMIFITTTNCTLDEELSNRCLILTINESRLQTRRIHELQRRQETLEGIMNELDSQDIIELHHNVQRMLRPLRVVNPFASRLKFNDQGQRSRRDHQKYLTLIRTITILHQYQREVKTLSKGGRQLEYIETTIDDIELANRLAGEVFKTTLDDLQPQTRLLLDNIYAFVVEQCKQNKIDQEDFRFSRRQLREELGLGNTQARVHLDRLVEHEYLTVHRGKRGQSFVYELVYQGELESRLTEMLGLTEIDSLSKASKGRSKK